MYEYPIKNVSDSNGNLVSSFEPDYPPTLEPNAYQFAGWYTTPECFAGTEYNFETATMPNSDLTLYAKWAPVQHEVKVYLDATLSKQIGTTQLVDHNDLAAAPDEAVENGNYTFSGWFYVDNNGKEKAFVFNSMPINQDLNIYAKWSSKVAVKYEVYYKLKDTDSAEALTISGFEFIGSKSEVNDVVTPVTGTTVSGTLTANGLLIELFYDRREVDYTVKYLENGTNKVLATEKIESGIYGQQVSETYLNIDGYELIGTPTRTLTLAATSERNVIIFYYQEKNITIQYEAVGSGKVSIGSENVLVISGPVNGSVPTPDNGYRFVGWYLNADCTSPVNSLWIDSSTGKILPQKNADGLYEEAIYYAKFEANNTDLTIKKKYPENADYSIDVNQTFIFDIKGVDGTATEDINLTVTVHGDGEITITDLPIGKYTITEQTDWSWRYKPSDGESEQTITLSPTEKNIVTFENTRAEVKWLDGDSYAVNIFNGTAN